MSRLQSIISRYLTPTNLRAARAAILVAGAILGLAHGVHVPHVLADDDLGGP